MNIILLGINHKTAPLSLREKLSRLCGDDHDAIGEIMSIDGVKECLFLATCNRVEIIAKTTNASRTVERLRSFLIKKGDFREEDVREPLYRYHDHDAVAHLFRVASGLDSMVMGEPQILGQVKDAFRTSVDKNATGVILNKLLHHTFRVAKRVRSETGIAENAVSVSYSAVELAKKIFDSLAGKTVLLVGAGEMGELAARHLLSSGTEHIIFINRTFSRAVQLAEMYHGEARPFDELIAALCETDIVISSTGAPAYVFDEAMVRTALHRRRNRLLLCIDIAVPRDFDPAAGRIDTVYLYNIDDLQAIVDDNIRTRRVEAEKAEEIIAEEVKEFDAWFQTREVVPTIVAITEKADSIKERELKKFLSKMKHLGEEDRREVEAFSSAVVKKMLHDPIASLKKEAVAGDAGLYTAALRRLFRLDRGDK